MLACAPGVLTAVSRYVQPHLASMKSFVTGERSSKKKGQGGSLCFYEHGGPSIPLSPLLRMDVHPTTVNTTHMHKLRECKSHANTDTHLQKHSLREIQTCTCGSRSFPKQPRIHV